MRLRFGTVLAAAVCAALCPAGAYALAADAAAEPLAQFGVISDIHLLPSDQHRSDVLRDALKYMDARKADGVVACGDLTQNGTVAELRAFGDIWRAVFPGNKRSDGEHVEKLFVYGDHDTEPTFLPGVFAHHKKHGVYPDWLLKRGDIVLNDRAKQWKAAFDEDFAPIMRKRVKGFDFVLAHLVNLDEDDMRYADPLHIPGLEEFFEANTFDRDKPFFYVQHKIPRGTVGGPTQTGQDSGRTSAILSRHPNAIALNGHKHRMANEELSLWQGAFTAIQSPALFTLLTAAGRENGRCSCDSDKTDPPPQMAQLNTVSDGSHALLMTIWPDLIIVDRVDIFHDGEPVATPWTIPWPNDGSASFEARGQSAPVPRFADGAKVNAKLIDGQDRAGNALRQIEVRFPPAQSTADSPRAYDYEVQAVLRKALVTRIVSTKRVYSRKCYWPEKYDADDVVCLFGRFEIPNDHDSVTFVVRPLNAWGIAGPAIESEPAAYDKAPVQYPY
jgi:predicted phosphodiesterase